MKFTRPPVKGQFTEWKQSGHRVGMLTCYDYPSAKALVEAGVEMLLVGDSLGPNVLGYASVREVTLGDISHHLAAVRRGAPETWIVADLPRGTFESPEMAVASGRHLLDTGADLVKIEVSGTTSNLVAALAGASIPVVAHIGHKPQFHTGGSPVVGRTAEEMTQLAGDASAAEQAGADVLLMECVPARLAAWITETVRIPTIGIGAGPGCNGQVLVLPDLLGWFDHPYRFILKQDHFSQRTREAAEKYNAVVGSGEFPGDAQSFGINEKEFLEFLRHVEHGGAKAV